MNSVARWDTLRRLRIAGEAMRASIGPTMSQANLDAHMKTILAALRDAVEAGIPTREALEAAFDRDDVAHVWEVAWTGVTELDRVEAQTRGVKAAEADRDRPAIQLPERFPEAGESLAEVDVRDRAAIQLPEHFPNTGEVLAYGDDADARVEPTVSRSDAGESQADLEAIDAAAAAMGATLAKHERRIAANMVNELRIRARRVSARGPRIRQSCGVGPILRRARASRAPHRARQRIAVAPTRDGPPPSTDPPAPLADGVARRVSARQRADVGRTELRPRAGVRAEARLPSGRQS